MDLSAQMANGAALEALDCQTEPVSAMLLTNLLQIIGAVQL